MGNSSKKTNDYIYDSRQSTDQRFQALAWSILNDKEAEFPVLFNSVGDRGQNKAQK